MRMRSLVLALVAGATIAAAPVPPKEKEIDIGHGIKLHSIQNSREILYEGTEAWVLMDEGIDKDPVQAANQSAASASAALATLLTTLAVSPSRLEQVSDKGFKLRDSERPIPPFMPIQFSVQLSSPIKISEGDYVVFAVVAVTKASMSLDTIRSEYAHQHVHTRLPSSSADQA